MSSLEELDEVERDDGEQADLVVVCVESLMGLRRQCDEEREDGDEDVDEADEEEVGEREEADVKRPC